MKAFQVLQEIENAQGSNAKKELLKKNETNEYLKFLIETSLNPFFHYGVNNFDDGKIYSKVDYPELNTLQLLRKALVEKKATGHAARDLMRKVLLCKNDLARKWLVRCFRKRIKSGISDGTVGKVFPHLIPQFKIGCCNIYETGTPLLKPHYVEPKLDGFRCLIFVQQDGTIGFVSRNRKPVYNTEHIEEEVRKLAIPFMKRLGDGFVLDGEMIAKNNWNLTAKILRKQTRHKKRLKLQYHIFDFVRRKDWDRKTSNRLKERKWLLDQFIGKNSTYLKYVNHSITNDIKVLKTIYEGHLKGGYEGVVLKMVDSLYPFGRNDDWLKYKPVQTHDVKIVGFKEGKEGTKYRGMLGALICKFKGKDVRFKVGSGLDDNLRKRLWKRRFKLKGVYAEIECQEITKDGKARFPVFMRLREDK